MSRNKTTEEFIHHAKQIHGDKYDYSLTNYVNAVTKVIIICTKHGEFLQSPHMHLRNVNCPKCSKNKNIEYVCGKTFINCKHIRKLPFDFYLPKYNTVIEFDGIQHFQLNEFFTNKIEFENLQKRDKIKTQFCNDHHIDLIRIKYDEIVEDKLNIVL